LAAKYHRGSYRSNSRSWLGYLGVSLLQ